MSSKGRVMTGRLRAFALVAAVVSAVVAGCATDPNAPDTPATLPAVTVGSGNSVVSDLIARFYAGALQRMGTRVTTEFDLGDRAAYLSQLGSGRVTVVPEFTDELLTYYDPEARQREPEQVYTELSKSLPEGLSVSDYANGTDSRADVVTTALVANRLNARSLDDLGPHCRGITLGEAVDGPSTASLTTSYSCTFAAVRKFPADKLAAALATGEIQAAILPPAQVGGFVVLDDDKYAIPAENPLPLFHADALTQAQLKKINAVAGELNTDSLNSMVQDITAGRETPANEARSWLDLHGF
jgi:osmoprotectant transport system substrate-binding protein